MIELIGWQILYWVWVLSEIVIFINTRTRDEKGVVRDRGSLFVLWAVISLSITAGMWIGSANAPTIFGGARSVRMVSVILLAAGLTLRWTAIFALDKSFSANVAIHATQTIHKAGIYRYIRHPSYSGLLLIFTAVGLHTRNWIGLAVLLVFPTAALLYRIQV